MEEFFEVRKNGFSVSAAVFRGDAFPNSLGAELLLLYELQLLRKSESEKSFVFICGDRKENYFSTAKELSFQTSVVWTTINQLREAFSNIEQMIALSPREFDQENLSPDFYDYGALKRISKLRQKALPAWSTGLKLNSKLGNSARDFLWKHAPHKKRVSLHLKSVPGQGGLSNANWSEWFKFFQMSGAINDKHFFIVGRDEIPNEIRQLKNITIVKEYDEKLVFQLAVIAETDAFMGMSSGLCQIAILGQKPYVIYKNPDHHAKEMTELLKGKNAFDFAQPKQIFLQQNENAGDLLKHSAMFFEEESVLSV